MAAITGDTTAIYTKDANQMIYKKEANVYSITVKPLKMCIRDRQKAFLKYALAAKNILKEQIEEEQINGKEAYSCLLYTSRCV